MLGFVFSVHEPALARHIKRKLCISIHVDDELLAGEKDETIWLMEALEKTFTRWTESEKEKSCAI